MSARVTLKDVAAHAGVSRSTASNVMAGVGRASRETRDRVHASMRELGYVYNRGAASLRTQRSNTIGVVVTNIASPFFGEMLVGLEDELRAAGFLSMVVATGYDPVRQQHAIEELREHQVAGLAIVPAVATSLGLLKTVEGTGTPYVFMTRYLEGEGSPYVGPDDVAGGRLAAEHLLRVHGCRSLAYVGGDETYLARRDRLHGVRSAARTAGLGDSAIVDIPGDAGSEGGLAAGVALLDGSVMPDGIICHSDSVAFGFYRALRLKGARTESVRVIGYDDIRGASLWEPPLTSVATHAEQLGRLSARKLLGALDVIEVAPAALIERLAPELRIRQSCGCDHGMDVLS